jgi:hypothetical protein
MHDRPQPMLPRRYSCGLRWLALCRSSPWPGPAFFKSGPFAYHGLLAFYMPVVAWGAYIVGPKWFMFKELKRSSNGVTPTG